MARIENIKSKIIQLDAGSFQNLCDTYLSKIGYPNIVSLGAEAGTRKTTKGTPDTYFYTSEEKYVFVEYTTQTTILFKKIRDDIEKCLDVSKTNIPHDKISEIIYCHTSSNITPAQDDEMKSICKRVGVKLTMVGIDAIAEDLYLSYHGIARDHLGIAISTGQIQPHDEFVKYYNANKMAAPIDTNFLFRDKELSSIDTAYQKTDIVILSGSAGAGKTRLALHYAKNRSNTDNAKLYCLHSNALPIFDDLKLFIDVPGNYFFMIDDANQLSGLQHVLRYTVMKPEGYNVKILITVRDYAIQKVINDIRAINSFEVVNVGVFTDDEIKKLLETALGILNSDYQERIIRIAEGNARIAILAGKIACDSNRLDSINDVSQLYENYYTTCLQENQLLANNNMCITAGIVAFLEAIHLDYTDSFLPILQGKGLTRDSFIENIRKLHDQEIVDICNDKAVRFSEQCLSNYLLKYVFFDKKLLSLSAMIKASFQSHKERTISSINTLLNIFRNEALYQFVKNEINTLWAALSQEESRYFFEFAKAFFRFNSTEALQILRDKIESEDSVVVKSSDIDTEKGKNTQHITNEIIEILGGFADMPDLPTALDLFFQYYLKRPDLYMQFYHAANRYFCIKKDSIMNKCFTQITFFKRLKIYSNNWEQESIVILFSKVAGNFLQLHFSPLEAGRNKNTVAIYKIPLVASDEGVTEYRGQIWQALTDLCKIDKYKEDIRKVLASLYYGITDDISIPVMEFDLIHIESILKSAFPPCKLQNYLLAERLAQAFKHVKYPDKLLFAEYSTVENESFHLYRLLKGVDYKEEMDFNELRKLKKETIFQHALNCDLKAFKRLIDVCCELDSHSDWRVCEGFKMAFDAISQRNELYVDIIEYYIQKDTPLNLHPDRLVGNLFSLLSDSEVFNMINKYNYNQKNTWLYSYYHELPSNLITEKHLQGLYNFLSDSSDGALTSSPSRDVNFLEKYNIINKEAFINGCKIILEKMKYSPFMAHIYFDLLFNPHCNTPQAVIQKFNGNVNLLEEIYLALLSHNKNHDYDGKFLIEIYLAKPSILNKYINHLVEKTTTSPYHFGDNREKLLVFYKLDNFTEVLDSVFDQLIHALQRANVSISCFLESLLLPSENEPDLLQKQNEWIKHCIQSFYNEKKGCVVYFLRFAN